MRKDFYYESCGAGQIHGCRWTPEGPVRAVMQIVHGIAEHVERYDAFAQFLNTKGILVVAEDHMGHGRSIEHGGTIGYFDGGWDAAVKDSMELLDRTMAEYPGKPYVLFGHSMGSFLVRSMLIRYPDSGISGAVVCGTGWQPNVKLEAGILTARMVAKKIGERSPSEKLQGMVFSGYNKRVEHKRTQFDWLSRDSRVVDAYMDDPMCGFCTERGLTEPVQSAIMDMKREK